MVKEALMARFPRLSRLPPPARWSLRVLAVLLALVLLLTGYVTWTVRRSFPQLDGRAALPGLAHDVTVERNRWGVPHVYADTAEDLFRAEGYVHAQDRFWEMDFRRHVTAGRLSELFGAATLDTDKVVRTLGWRRVAERELGLVSPDARRYLEAYAQGVNAWLRGHTGATASLEYAVLGLRNRGYRPEPWTPADSLAWLKAMAWDLRSNMSEELSRALAAAKVPAGRVDQLYPEYPYERNPTIVDGGAVSDGKFESARPSRPLEAGGAAAAAEERVARAVAGLPALLGDGGQGIGSNSWVVAGSRTATGKPLLANDPHLAPHMPSLWYQAGLHCRTRGPACPFDVTGFTFSGVPGVVIGHNDRIAWGFTNLGPDVTDLYIERLSGQGYEYRGKREPFQTRTEEIEVAGGRPVTITVRSTRHGPLLSDVMPDAHDAATSAPAARRGPAGQSYGIALRWTALDPGRTADALFLLDAARDWEGFRAAAARFEVPAQNLVYADVDGSIGYQAPGKIPVRTRGDGRWPVPGWTGGHEWRGYIPFDELPSVENPPAGYIVTANNAAVEPGYPRLLTKDWAYGYRAQRITELLRRERIDVAGMEAIQLDVHNPFAPTLVPHLFRVGASGHAAEALGMLRGWDFAQDAGSAPAAFYNAVWRHLLLRVFNDELPEDARPSGEDQWFEVVRSLLALPDDPWWDDVRTADRREARDDVLRAAIADAGVELRKRLGDDPRAWRWGDLHTLELTNETFGTSGIPPIERLFNRGPLRLGGGSSIVDAVGWDVQQGYEVNWVPSMRMVVDLAGVDRSRWVNLTGNSGHAFAGNYADQAPLWASGRTIPMPSTPQSVRRETVGTLTLRPA
jgi:penicillin amidase